VETPFDIPASDSEKLLREFQVGTARAILKVRRVDLGVLESLGAALTRLGRHHEALEVDRRIVDLQPDSAVAWYNLGCSLANLGQSDAALGALDKAVRLGYRDVTHIVKDPDLRSLRTDERFLALIQRLRGGLRSRRKRR
jgi:tetratricopeptide (TPR) repeat protein